MYGEEKCSMLLIHLLEKYGSHQYFARIPTSVVKYHPQCCESEEELLFAKQVLGLLFS